MKIAWKTINGYGPYAYLQESVWVGGTPTTKHVAYLGKYATAAPAGSIIMPGHHITHDGERTLVSPVPVEVLESLKPGPAATVALVDKQLEAGVPLASIGATHKALKGKGKKDALAAIDSAVGTPWLQDALSRQALEMGAEVFDEGDPSMFYDDILGHYTAQFPGEDISTGASRIESEEALELQQSLDATLELEQSFHAASQLQQSLYEVLAKAEGIQEFLETSPITKMANILPVGATEFKETLSPKQVLTIMAAIRGKKLDQALKLTSEQAPNMSKSQLATYNRKSANQEYLARVKIAYGKAVTPEGRVRPEYILDDSITELGPYYEGTDGVERLLRDIEGIGRRRKELVQLDIEANQIDKELSFMEKKLYATRAGMRTAQAEA